MMLETAWVGFKIIARAMLLNVQIEGHPVSAIIDTGAPVSVVSPRLAAQFDLKQEQMATLHSDIGTHRTLLAGPLALDIGAKHFTLSRVAVVDLSLLSKTGEPVEFVIGQDVINASAVTIDFDHEHIEFAPATNLPLSQGFFEVPLRRDAQSRYYTKFRIGNLPESDAIVDLGNASALMLSADVYGASALDPSARSSTAVIGTVSGIAITKVSTVKQISIGETVIKNVPTDFLTQWRSPQPANIGLPVLSRFTIILDASRDRMWLKPSHRAARQSFDKDLSGLGFSVSDRQLEVVHVADDSPAASVGWNVGDHIISINGHPIDSRYFQSRLWRWRYGELGMNVSLELDDRTIRKLQLKTYY